MADKGTVVYVHPATTEEYKANLIAKLIDIPYSGRNDYYDKDQLNNEVARAILNELGLEVYPQENARQCDCGSVCCKGKIVETAYYIKRKS